MDLKTAVRSIPDFPKPGILFRDVTTLFQDPEAFRQLIDELAKSLEGKQVDPGSRPGGKGLRSRLCTGLRPERRIGAGKKARQAPLRVAAL